MRRALLASLLGAGLGLACGGGQEADPAAATKTDAKATDKADPAAGQAAEPGAAEKADDEQATKHEPADPLTEEELKLIEADPKELSPDDRRLRAYALRKKIMQNPDSDAAKAIREGMEAIERGEVDIPEHLLADETKGQSSGPVLSAPPANKPAAEPGTGPLK